MFERVIDERAERAHLVEFPRPPPRRRPMRTPDHDPLGVGCKLAHRVERRPRVPRRRDGDHGARVVVSKADPVEQGGARPRSIGRQDGRRPRAARRGESRRRGAARVGSTKDGYQPPLVVLGEHGDRVRLELLRLVGVPPRRERVPERHDLGQARQQGAEGGERVVGGEQVVGPDRRALESGLRVLRAGPPVVVVSRPVPDLDDLVARPPCRRDGLFEAPTMEGKLGKSYELHRYPQPITRIATCCSCPAEQ